MSELYHHVRFRWWERANLEKIAEEFRGKYAVDMRHFPSRAMDIELHKDERDELIVTADTLMGYLSRFRAVLSQKKPAKFTAKDVELRRQVREIYSQDRPTPFPWMYSQEMKYEVQQ